MKSNFKFVALTLAFAMLLSIFAGCGFGDDGPSWEATDDLNFEIVE